MIRVVTIGAIGFTKDTFFATLQDAGVDTLVDIRRRRAVRGREYAFANSQRLQTHLADLGIRYLHRIDLAPPNDLRQRQAAADEAAGVAKRKRMELSPTFIDAYKREVLSSFDPRSLIDDLPPDAAVVALMCVEREPAACHRALLAERLREDLGVELTHLMP